MLRTLRTRALTVFCAAVYTVGAAASANAATNVATLTVNATINNNCVVATQPAALAMTYDTVQNLGTMGTSSFTYTCTKNGSISVTPASTNVASGSNWEAVNGTNDLLYLLYNDSACSVKQLTNGTVEALASGTGAVQTYNICATPNTTSQQNLPAGAYTDTVTFTFNFTP